MVSPVSSLQSLSSLSQPLQAPENDNHQNTPSGPARVQSPSTMREPRLRLAADLHLDRLEQQASSPGLPDTDIDMASADTCLEPSLQVWVDNGPADEQAHRNIAARALQAGRESQVHLSALNISDLPAGLSLKSLILEQCHNLRRLPLDCDLTHNLQIMACRSLTGLPALQLAGDLKLQGLPRLHEWYGKTELGGDLLVQDCPRLLRPPCSMSVAGNAKFADCALLQGLSEQTVVDGDLHISNCPNLSDLPFRPIRLGGDLHLEHLPFLRQLPAWLDELNGFREPMRQVRFHEIGVSAIDQLGVQERLTNVNVQLDDTISRHSPKAALKTIVQKWLDDSEIACTGEAGELMQRLPESLDLLKFLEKLSSTKEYELDARTFACRVCRVLHQLADQQIPQQSALQAIYHMLTSCHDGVVKVFQDLEIMGLVESARRSKRPKVFLRALAEDLIKLEVLQEYTHTIAAAQREQGRNPDEVEINLYLETRLADRIVLPTQNRHMLFPGMARVTVDQLNECEQLAMAAARDEQRLATFLDCWHPWQQQLRDEALATFEKAGHPVMSLRPNLAEQECPFTQKQGFELQQPVVIKGHTGIFEADDLLQWWRDNGNHPVTFESFDLNQLIFIRPVKF